MAGNTLPVLLLLLLLASRLPGGKSIFPHRGWLVPQHTELG
jgi:hypothetical protein